MLRLCDIVKEYPTATTTVQALRGVSLSFRESEFVAILGPSGCGKTTMLNIIGGLDRYTSGDLIIGGVSTVSFDDLHWDAYRNATIGFVFQSYNLIPHLTVLENVELALRLNGEKKKVRRAKAVAALNRVGMAAEINKRPNQLSGGQMQRVAIARAIVNDPKIILADEPTGALDSELSVSVMEILQEISQKCLVIMVTHNAELAAQYATRICRFKDGQLVEDTNPYDPLAEEGKTAYADLNVEDDGIVEKDPAQELVTTDTISESSEEAADGTVTAENSSDETVTDIEISAEGEHCVEPVTAVDLDALITNESEHGSHKSKRLPSNHKRKKQLKTISDDSRRVFEKLGLNGTNRKRKKIEKKNKTFKPTSMSVGMAFGLSLRNLISKKRRTFLTAFAGSIGIIGLGLVLSISNGFDVFVKNMQTEMLAGVPLGVYEYNVEASAVMDVMSSFAKPSKDPDAYPDGNKITVDKEGSGGSSSMDEILNSFFKSVSRNDITEEFDEYMSRMPEEYYSAYSAYYGVQYNLISEAFDLNGTKSYKNVSQTPAASTVMTIATSILGESGMQPASWQVLIGGEENMLAAYELIGGTGHYPKNKNELVLCVNEKNQIDESLLETFGINMIVEENGEYKEISELTTDFFIGKKLKLLLNDDYYSLDESTGWYTEPGKSNKSVLEPLYNSEKAIELEIVGVIRPKQGVTAGYVSSAICYTPELARFVVDNSYDSEIAKFQRELIAQDVAAAGGEPNQYRTAFGGFQKKDDNFASGSSIIGVTSKTLGWSNFIKRLGVTKAPVYINVYPLTYDQKINSGKYIADWNTRYNGNVGYFDVSEMFIYNLNMIIDLVSIMLIAVASISLVVSTVMIGVITSNSVIERTREIGILRSIGARKRDIRNVFIAETSLIGLAGGLIGIVLTYILCPIISAVIGAVSGVQSLLHFHPLHAFILVVLSLLLTIVSGILPAIGASRKNVVDALRVE